MDSQEKLNDGSGLDSTQQSEDMNALEANDEGTRLPAVNRSVRFKQQRNWKWKLWCFTKGRVLQPISETAESPKDEASKDENILSSDGENEQDPEWSGDCTTGQHENDTESKHETDGTRKQEKDTCVGNEIIIASPKDQYSACYKLIEKFQEAVLDNAVRIIQAAFKRFTQRRRFLRLRKAATVIQRNVRKWLQQQHPSNSKAEEPLSVSCEKASVVVRDIICKSSRSCLEAGNSQFAVQADDCEVMREQVWQEMEISKNEFLQPDIWDHSPSPLQILKLEEPDSVSLTDSGIDSCSVASVEAVIEENNPEFKAGLAYHHVSSEDLVLRASSIFGQDDDIECLELEKCPQESI